MKESALKLIKIAAFDVFKVFIWPDFAVFSHFVLGCAFFPVITPVAARCAFVDGFLARAAAATYLAGFLVRLTKAF